MLKLDRDLERSKGFALAVAGAAILFFVLAYASPNLAPVLSHPTTVAYHGGVDAWKNIYTVAYHGLHDTSFIRTDAFNYPAGEHIVFADGQPLLSNALRLSLVSSPGTAVAIVQLAPWVGGAIGLALLAWLFARLGVSNVYAALAALVICLLSPQLARASGHYGLSYVFVIPALLHVLLSWSRTRQSRYIIACGGLTAAFALLHLYLLAICLALVIPTIGYVCAVDARRRWRSLGVLALTVAALGAAYYAYGVLAWQTRDRPAIPEGFFDAASTWKHVFLMPYTLPALFAQFGKRIYPSAATIEELGYVGAVASVFCLALVWAAGAYVVGRVSEPFSYPRLAPRAHAEGLYLAAILFAAVLSLLVSFGIPLRYAWFETYAPDIGLLRQFRALGRFNWVFYYVINVLAFVALYRFGESPNTNGTWSKYAKRLSIFALGIALFEGINNLRAVDTNPFPLPWGERMDTWLAAIGPVNQYQAILPIPYFHIGGETLNAPLGQDDLSISTQLGLATGLSNLGVFMSRQGVANTYARLPLDHPWSSVPEVLAGLPSTRDILVTVSKEQLQTTIDTRGSDPYATLLGQCDTLLEDGNYLLMRLRGTPERFREVARAYCQKASFDKTYASPHFVTSPKTVVTLTRSGEKPDADGWQTFAEWTVPENTSVDVSWTTELSGATRPFHEFYLEARDLATGTPVYSTTLRAATDATILQREGARVKTTVPASGSPQRLHLSARFSPRSGPLDTLRIRYLAWMPEGAAYEYVLPEGDYLFDGIRYRECP